MAENEDTLSNDDNDDFDEEEAEDDEATLDEEDACNDEEDYDNELKELQEDGELSVEELRRKYYGDEKQDCGASTEEQSKEEDEVEEVAHQQETAQVSSSTTTTRRMGNLRGKIFTAIATTCDSITHYFKPEDVEGDDDSEDYMPPELWKKEIRVGPEFQVSSIPAIRLIPRKRTATPQTSSSTSSETSAEVLWKAASEICSESKVVDYLIQCEEIRASGGKPKNGPAQKRRAKATPAAASSDEIVPDDENALLALYQAAYDVNKAKAKAPFEVPAVCSANGPRLTQPPGPWKTWTEEDCANFEKGMLEHGKHFWKIRRDFLPERMLGEIVCFYYSWKKSERHDIWRAEKAKKDQQLDVRSTDLMGQIAESIMHPEGGDQNGMAAPLNCAAKESGNTS